MRFVDEGIEQHKRIQQVSRPSMGFWVGRAVGMMVGSLMRAAWAWRITLAWIALVAFLFAGDLAWAAYLFIAAGIGVMVAGYWQRPLWSFAPFMADYFRIRAHRILAAQVRDGRSFLVQSGICSPDVAETVFITLVRNPETVVLTLDGMITGLAPSEFVRKAQAFNSLLGAVRSAARPLDNAGVELTFYLVDPLDLPQQRDDVPGLEPDKMRVECAVNSFGAPVSLTFGDSSGMVVGGVPGSGKTAGLTSFLLPLALSKYVNLSIIDGKGGEDWTSYGSRADTYIRGDEDFVPILGFLEKKYSEMLERLDGQKQRLGTSNFWNASAEQRLAAGEKFELIVIDECQGLFEDKGRSSEEKAMMGKILRVLSSFVKRGRSAGFFVIFITQKPTNESLPTAIRDNSGLRVAFRLTTSAAETAVLGVLPDDALNVPRAISIPASRKGGAVLANDSGSFEDVRFFYVPEDLQQRLLEGGK